MEKENIEKNVTNNKILELLAKARNDDHTALLDLIDIFKSDIEKASNYTRTSQDDAISHIMLEFIELIKSQDTEELLKLRHQNCTMPVLDRKGSRRDID